MTFLDVQKAASSKSGNIKYSFVYGVDSCAGVTCRHGARCEHGRCVCPQHCPPASGEEICASDGRTYASECLMRLAACQRSVDLDVVSHAPCDRDDVISGSGSGELTQSRDIKTSVSETIREAPACRTPNRTRKKQAIDRRTDRQIDKQKDSIIA